MDDMISRAAAIEAFDDERVDRNYGDVSPESVIEVIESIPTIDAIPVEWLNERHRKCCEEGDTDLMDAITVLCNEYHVWQKEQEAQDG